MDTGHRLACAYDYSTEVVALGQVLDALGTVTGPMSTRSDESSIIVVRRNDGRHAIANKIKSPTPVRPGDSFQQPLSAANFVSVSAMLSKARTSNLRTNFERDRVELGPSWGGLNLAEPIPCVVWCVSAVQRCNNFRAMVTV